MLSFVALVLLLWLVFAPAYKMATRDSGRSELALATVDHHRADDSEVPSVFGTGGLDSYIRGGLEDLRIMLAQHARGRDNA